MFGNVWYKLVMDRKTSEARVFTPEQVAEMLQLSKNTVYDLISRGEIIAKKIGKVYRIPVTSLSFMFTGLDYDLYQADQADAKNKSEVKKDIKIVRQDLFSKIGRSQ